MEEKIKVVWICSVSNPQLRGNLLLRMPLWHKAIRFFLRRKVSDEVEDYAVWNTNAIREFQNMNEVELSVIFVHPNMHKLTQQFRIGNISFHAVNSGDTFFLKYFRTHISPDRVNYKRTWKKISSIVETLQPDIIHIMGAENPPYSLSIFQLPSDIPVITQLQTLLNDSETQKYHCASYKRQAVCEYKVLRRTNYIGTTLTAFQKKIREQINKDAVFVKTGLIIAEKPDLSEYIKSFDFVYFASDIHKSIDLAIEGFALACKKCSSLTLDVIGGVSKEELQQLSERLKELGIARNVTIEGKLPTHDDVLRQIKKARFALLPLKIDFVSGTIREAMWSGLPVVSTITQGTPSLNEKRESILLSEIGDHKAMANNMMRLFEDSDLAERLRSNAAITVEEKYGNNTAMAHHWVSAYRACIENFRKGTPLPDNI